MSELNLYDANLLYTAAKTAVKAGTNEDKKLRYKTNIMVEVAKLQKRLDDGTYKPSPGYPAVICERGHIRHIVSNTMVDKTVNHFLADNFIRPSVYPLLIYDNSASQPEKGVSFARERVLEHLRRYYNETGSFDGYVLQMDFQHFYDSIDHAKVKRVLHKTVNAPEEILAILESVVDSFGGTVGVDMGNQISQEIGVLFPFYIDNYIQIVRGQKYYHRYSDDSILIAQSKEELSDILDGINRLARMFGLQLHPTKTHISKLSKGFRFLQFFYIPEEETGKVIVKINPKSLKRERDRLKGHKRKMVAGELPYSTIEASFRSWMCAYYQHMSNDQILNLIELYRDLFEKDIEWPDRHRRLQRLTGQKHGIKLVPGHNQRYKPKHS